MTEARSERFRPIAANGELEPELHTLQWGDPTHEKLVLLHGGAANAHWWDHLAPQLSRRFHVIALDFRGHGDSERPESLREDAFYADLRGLVDHLGGHRVVVMGASMGAHVAMDYAAHNQDLRGLILVDPSRGQKRDREHGRRFRLALSFRASYATREEAIARFSFLPPAPFTSEELRHAIAEHSVEMGEDERWGYKFDPRWFRLPSRPRPDLSQVSCPTLLLRGAESGILSEDGAQALASEFPMAKLLTVDRSGHHIQLDRPAALLLRVQEFLSQLPPDSI